MSKTFLQLLTSAHKQTNLQGSPSSVLDPGLVGTLAASISQAWVDIQDDNEDWKYMKGVFNDFYTVTGQPVYTPSEVFGASVNLFGSYVPNMIFKYGEKRAIPWATFTDFHLLNTDRDPAPPAFVCTETAGGELYINTPDTPARLQIFYQKATQILEEDADIVQLPDKYVATIKWLGLYYYAITTGNNNLKVKAQGGMDTSYGNLLRKYNPQKTLKPRKFLI